MLAVITGASSGIGAAFARQLAKRGYDVLLVARREERLRELAAEIQKQHGVTAETQLADLTLATDCAQVAARIQAEPNLGLLVNNAGFGTNGYFFETDLEGQVAMHELHVVATVRLCHAALKNLTANQVSSAQARSVKTGIINVSSVAAFSAAPQNASYSATKRWMNTFTEGLAMELGGTGKNIVVQALCPGYTHTEFQDKLSVDKSRIPQSFWMPAEFVVAESLKGFDQGKLFVVPGWRYKLLLGVVKVLPGSMLRWATIRAVRRYRRKKAQ
jgi:short-subunit dehydrogenase